MKCPREYKKAKTEDGLNVFIMGLVEPKKVYTGKELENWPHWMEATPVTKAFHNGWKAGIEVGLYLSTRNLVSIGIMIKSKGSYAGLEGFDNIKHRDAIKNHYCADNDILLIRIPYS